MLEGRKGRELNSAEKNMPVVNVDYAGNVFACNYLGNKKDRRGSGLLH